MDELARGPVAGGGNVDSQEPVPDDQFWESEPVEADDFFMKTMPWQEMSPEFYAARYSHQVYCYSLCHMRFRNPEIAKWARRLGDIMFDSNELERVRREYLTVEEYRQVLREMAECEREMAKFEQGSLEPEQGEDR